MIYRYPNESQIGWRSQMDDETRCLTPGVPFGQSMPTVQDIPPPRYQVPRIRS